MVIILKTWIKKYYWFETNIYLMLKIVTEIKN